jgi:hypothetical protein
MELRCPNECKRKRFNAIHIDYHIVDQFGHFVGRGKHEPLIEYQCRRCGEQAIMENCK